MIHLSGHADIDEANGQPVFLLEDELGQCALATPEELALTLRDANSTPRVVFLAGCRTGESGQQTGMLSFSEQMVNTGVPVVLGWALPVGDVAASQAAAVLYDKLATGFAIADAVALARQTLLKNNSPFWHLLRAYVDGSVLNPLVNKGKLRVRQHHTPQQFLDAGGRVPVCAREDFIGRRRLLQRSLRCLRALQGDAAYAEGVLLHGMGGLGKSSTAARLIDRLRPGHTAVVCYGGLDEVGLIAAIGKVLPKAKSLLNDASETLEKRLRELFEQEDNPLCTKPLLLVFDDFEQNIPEEQRKLGQATYNPPSLEVLHTVLQAIREGGSDTRVIVTSRFEVPVPHPCRLHSENPATLRDADLNKKLSQLPGLHKLHGEEHAEENALRDWAVRVAAGNPRLLEWLNGVLLERSLPVEALLDKLETKEAEFREVVLIDALVDAQTPAVRHTLACAALYRLPVALAAIEVLTESANTAQDLQQAARMGLVEMTPTVAESYYFVSGLLEKALVDELDASQQQVLAGKASQHVFAQEDSADALVLRSEAWALEIVRLAVLGQERDLAVEVADPLTVQMLHAYRYREAEQLCQRVLTLGEEFRMLTQLARAEQSLGKGTSAVADIERAVQLLPVDKTTLSDAMLKETALTMGAFADILQARGQLDEALSILQTEQLPVYEKLGDVRSKAVTMGKIADILQARGQLDEALSIRENHELPVYEKLGDVRSLLVGRVNLGILLWQKDAAANAARVQELLCLALTDARRLRIPEAGIIENILSERGLSCDGSPPQ